MNKFNPLRGGQLSLVLKIAHAHCMCEGAFRLDGNFRNPFQVFPNKKKHILKLLPNSIRVVYEFQIDQVRNLKIVAASLQLAQVLDDK